MKDLRDELLKEIEIDEYEYCFDRSYCNDDTWKEFHGTKTRELAFEESMNSFNKMTTEEIIEFFGDKYVYVLEKHGYRKEWC